ncbi:MAG: TatD family hydrolase, partial [Thermococcus sp.]
MMNLYDTHAHLQSRDYDKDRNEVIRRTKAVLSGVLMPGYDIDSSRRALTLRDDFFKVAVGIHPHYAADFKDRLDEVRALASSADAVGEIGLDYYRNLSPRDVQKEVFYNQLLIATELKKPIVIHEREAFEDVWDIITGVSPDVPVIFHCFSHGAEEIKKVLSVENFIPAFCGNLTYKKADNLR